MQFGLIELWDTFFSFDDRWMLTGSIYGCFWLILAVALLIIRRRETHVPSVLFLSVYFLVCALLIVRTTVLTLSNIVLPPNVHLGILSSPPLWLSAAAIAIGLLLGWRVARSRAKKMDQSERFNKGTESHAISLESPPMALVLSFSYPGMGQVYYGHYWAGLLGFLLFCFFSDIFRLKGCIAIFTLIQTETLLNKPIERILRGKKGTA